MLARELGEGLSRDVEKAGGEVPAAAENQEAKTSENEEEKGRGEGSEGVGVEGRGDSHGGYFQTTNSGGRGVEGYASSRAAGGSRFGGYFTANGASGKGVYGRADGSSGVGVTGVGGDIGVKGHGDKWDFWADHSKYGNDSSIRWKNDIRLIDDPLGKVSAIRVVQSTNWNPT